jgi:hypothetical protein
MDSTFDGPEEKEIKIAVEQACSTARTPEQLLAAVRAQQPRLRRWKIRLDEAPERVTLVVDPVADPTRLN